MTDRPYFPLKDLRDLMDPNFVNTNKINCIKHIRDLSGEGLKETKEFFEQEWLPFVNGDRKPPKEIKTFFIENTPEFDALKRWVEDLSRQVNALSKDKTKQMAASIFKEGD